MQDSQHFLLLVNLTNLDISDLTSGTVPDARFPTLPVVLVNLTDLNGSNIASGTVAAARVPTLNQNTTGTAGGLSGTPDITVNNITGVFSTFTGVLTYEDVTNVDSIGVVTARSGIEFGVAGVGGTITDLGHAEFVGVCTASSFVKEGGTSSQFLKGDGSVDSTTYGNTGKALDGNCFWVILINKHKEIFNHVNKHS